MYKFLVCVFVLVLAGCGSSGGDNNGGGEGCNGCIGVNVAGPGLPPDTVVSCEPSGEFNCACVTESGDSATLALEPGVGCIF